MKEVPFKIPPAGRNDKTWRTVWFFLSCRRKEASKIPLAGRNDRPYALVWFFLSYRHKEAQAITPLLIQHKRKALYPIEQKACFYLLSGGCPGYSAYYYLLVTIWEIHMK